MRNVVVIFVGTILALFAFMLASAYHDDQTSVQPGERLSGEQLLKQWERDYALYDTYSRTPIRLAYSKGISKRFTKALGRAEINFETGEVNINIQGLEPLPDGFIYEAWLVDHIPGEGNSVALDLGDDGDRFINLGTLPLGGSMVASVDPKELADFEVDMAAVVQVGPTREPEFIAGGFQPVAFKSIRQAKLQRERDGFNWLAKKVEAAGNLKNRSRKVKSYFLTRPSMEMAGPARPVTEWIITSPSIPLLSPPFLLMIPSSWLSSTRLWPSWRTQYC